MSLSLVLGPLLRNQAQSIAYQPVPTLLKVAPIPALQKPEIGTESTASTAAKLETPESQLLKNVTAQAVYVMDVNSGSVLLEKNATTLKYPASTTKLMTTLVASELYSHDERVVITDKDLSTGSVIGLTIGEDLSVNELLSASLIQSANEAALALANHHPSGYAAFIEGMNLKAKQLHLDQTTFNNPSGIDDLKQQTSARDLAILAREVMKNQVLAAMVGVKTSTIGSTFQHTLYNTHALLGKNGVTGIKTGTTVLAGEVLITLIKREDREILIVLMGSQKRYDETQMILQWVEKQYTWLSEVDVANYAKK